MIDQLCHRMERLRPLTPATTTASGCRRVSVLENGEALFDFYQMLRRTNIYHALLTEGCMAINQIQPRNIFTASELTDARDFLAEADILVTDVKSLFLNRGEFTTADRLKDIQDRLASEIGAVERLIYFYALHNNLI
jgi:hypothetical protein